MSDTKINSPYVDGGSMNLPPNALYGIAIVTVIVLIGGYYVYSTYSSAPTTTSSFSMRDKFKALETRQQALLNKLRPAKA